MSKKMMPVSHFGLVEDEFEQIQTYCLAWVPVEHIALVMVMQASLAHMKTELMPLALEVIFSLLSSLAQGLRVFLEIKELNGFVFSQAQTKIETGGWPERGLNGVPVAHLRVLPTQLYSRKYRV